MVRLIHVKDEASLKQFNEEVMGGKAIVLYYMVGCGACEAMKPEWESFEEELQYNKSGYGSIDVLVARVRSDYLDKVECEHDLIGFPTILELKDGKTVREYNGERSKEGFMKFLKEVSGKMSGGRRTKRKHRKTRKSLKHKKMSLKRKGGMKRKSSYKTHKSRKSLKYKKGGKNRKSKRRIRRTYKR